MTKKLKLTPWFSGSTPPVREGWYEFHTWIESWCVYKRFLAYYRPLPMTFHLKKNVPGFALASFDRWRGLANEPSNDQIHGRR